VLSLSHVMHFLAHEFSRLGRRSLPFALILSRPLNRLGLWHGSSLVIGALIPSIRALRRRVVRGYTGFDRCLQPRQVVIQLFFRVAP
jgi:hypothetical protein